MTLKHRTQTAIADDPAYDVGADEWNADHIVATDFSPETDDGATLGVAAKQWSDIYLAPDGSINWIGASNNNRKVILSNGAWRWTTGFGNTQFFLDAAAGQAPRIQVGYTGDSFNRINFGITSAGVPQFQFGPGNTDRDTTMVRAAAATFQLGQPDDTAAVAQTLQAQSVVAGTSNTAGAAWTFNDSAGTGTGASGGYVFNVHPAGTSGTSQNAAATAFKINTDKTVQLAAFTVATLPTAGTAGRRAYVTDATAPTYNGALTGGGSVVVPVFDNGVAWVSA